MKKDRILEKMREKMNEVSLLPPQEVGILTPVYKKIVPGFKFYPWRIGLPVSVAAAVLLYMLFGALLVKLAGILQVAFF